MNFTIREGELQDLIQVLDLINELSISVNGIKANLTVYDLIRDGFSKKKYFKLFVAVFNTKVIGFAMFYNSYSLAGNSMVIEENFVTKDYRNIGIGIALFSKCLDYANKNNMKCLEWTYDERYPSLKELYQRAGAKVFMNTSIFTIHKKDIEDSVDVEPRILDNPYENYIIRFGTSNDMNEVFNLMEEVSHYRNESFGITTEDLISKGFSNDSVFKILVIEVDKKIIGFNLFYESYSVLSGKSLNIGEIYIKKSYRGFGFGKNISFALIQYAKENNFNKISQLIPDKDKPSIQRCVDFYAKRVNGLRVTRITKQNLANFINN